jgi:hypothetical protein
MPYLIECLRWLDMSYQPFQGVQVRDGLNFSDHGLCRIAEFEIEHDDDALNQARDAPLLNAKFFDAGDVGHLAFLLKRAQFLRELCSQRIRQAHQPIDEAEGQAHLLGSISESV